MERPLVFPLRDPRTLVEAVDVYTSIAVRCRKRMIELKDKLGEDVLNEFALQANYLVRALRIAYDELHGAGEFSGTFEQYKEAEQIYQERLTMLNP